jgi:gliding motility-associated-like protein
MSKLRLCFNTSCILLLLIASHVQLLAQPSFKNSPTNGVYNGSPAVLLDLNTSFFHKIKASNANGKGSTITVPTKPSFMTFASAAYVNSTQLESFGPAYSGNLIGALVRDNSTKRVYSVVKTNTDANIYVTDSIGTRTVFAQKLYHGSTTPYGNTNEGGMLIIGNYLYLGYVGSAGYFGGVVRYNLGQINPIGEVVVGAVGTTYKVYDMANVNNDIYIASGTADVIQKLVINDTTPSASVWSTISLTGIGAPKGLGFNSLGDLYIAGGTTGSCQIYKIPAASLGSPAATAVGPTLVSTVMNYLDFDSRDNMIVGGSSKLYRVAGPSYTTNTSYTIGQNIGTDMTMDDTDRLYFPLSGTGTTIKVIDFSPAFYTLNTTTPGVYAATITATDEASATSSQSFNIVVRPDAPYSSTSATYSPCVSTNNLTFSSLTNFFGNSDPLVWYTAASGGTIISASTALYNGTFYASQIVNNVESINRTAKTVNIGYFPDISVSPSSAAIQPGQSVTVTANTVAGSGYTWFANGGAASLANLSATTGASVVITPTATSSYYVQTLSGSCGNTAVVNVSVLWPVSLSNSTITAAQASIPANGSSTSTITVQLVDSLGTAFTSGGDQVTITSNLGTVGSVTDLGNGSYRATLSGLIAGQATLSFRINGALSPNTATVQLQLAAPTGSANQDLCNDQNRTLADLVVTGSNIRWYDNSSGGTLLASNTALVHGMTYYASQTQNGVESSSRFAVTVSISQAFTMTVSPSSAQILIGQSVSLNASGANAYVWFPSTGLSTTTGSSVVASPSNTVNYSVTGTSGSCSVTANILVYVGGLDADSDGVTDSQEALDGTNPNDGCSYLVASQVFANTSSSWRNEDCDGDGTANGTDSEPLNFCVGGSGQVPANGTPAYDIFRYQDCDNDGILNGLECSLGVNCPDFDNDGIPNYLDTDSDNDQIGDITEGNIDTDGDGSANYIDLDSDNDGILDIRETTQDFDGDGTPNYLDLDADADTILDKEEARATYTANSMTVPDTDKDGTPDFLDLESDGDGILDSIELNGDLDGDQHPNYRDGDSDGDGISDSVEKFGDMDGDGRPNFLDLDSDGDGLSDQYEGLNLCFDCGRVDNNDDGYDDRAQQDPKYPAVDTDKDGAPDFLDLDSDNDGIPDAVEAGNDPKNPVDTDQDGTPDFRDLDSDNDGIPDAIEAGKDPSVPVDTDKDGTPDFRDLDSDNDGITDAIEAGIDPTKPLDTDGDGIYDFRDLDSDNDGISDNIEKGPTATPVDTDKDGLPDYRDIDSDNDGISDNIEKGSTATPVDTDGDGTPDFRDLDSDNDGISDNIEKGPTATPVDTDGDGLPDFRDLDSDNDGISDNIEKGPTATPVDTDGDGLPDYRDLDSDNDGISDNIEKGPSATPVDTDGDGLPDYRDLDSDSDTLSDNIEKGPSATPVDTDKDGSADFRDLDSDNDGLTDKFEAGPDPKNPLDTDKDLIYDFRDTDSDNDGILDKDEDNVGVSGLADCDKDGIPNRLDPDKCPSFMPQGISPNGDGKNDTFIIPGILSAQPNTLTIFNRWGNVVYEKDNYQNDWHGQTDRAFDLLASDGLLPDGTYYYVVDYKGNKSNVKSFIYVNRLDK